MTPVVTVYHNVQHECRACGQPVADLGDGEWAHLRDDAGHFPVRVTASAPGGWRPSHAMVPVFRARVPAGIGAAGAAQRMYGAFNAGDLFSDALSPEDEVLAGSYQGRGLRPLGIGDVIGVGGALFTVAARGLRPAAGGVRVSWAGRRGTVPLPHCSRCSAIAGPDELEVCDRAGSLACRGGCSSRGNASP
jgi:hypothetical protein